jgi:signal transduction histidine kinase
VSLPDLDGYVLRGVRLTVLTGPIVVLYMWVAHWLYGDAYWGRTLPMGGAVIAMSLAWAVVVYRRPPRDPTWLHTALMVCIFLFLSLQSWCHRSGVNPFIHGAYVGYVAMSMACPMHWTRLLVLGGALTLGECLAAWLLGSSGATMALELGAGALTTFYCVLGVSMVRALWRFKEDAQSQLMASDRLSSLGRHTAGIAHELKTPLASAHNGVYNLKELAQELRESLGHPEVTEQDLREIVAELLETADHIEDGVQRAVRFVTTLREHTQQMHRSQEVWFSVQDRLDRVQGLLRHLEHDHQVQMSFVPLPARVSLFGDPGKFDQVVINLVTNAMEACAQVPRGGLRVKVEGVCAAKQFTLVVQDNGPGVPEAIQQDIFNPLFTTRGDQGGTGLGLALCRDIVQGVFGGQLSLASSGQGARFEVRLPLKQRARVKGAPSDTAAFAPFVKGQKAKRPSQSLGGPPK